MVGFALGLSLICFGSDGPTNEEHLLDVVRTAYRANRAALSFGTVRFQRVVDDQVRDEAAAFNGDLARDCCADGLLIYNEQKVRYESVFPSAVIASLRTQVSQDQWQSMLDPSIRILTDGKLTLFDSIYVDDTGQKATHTAQIFPADSRYFDGTLVPLNLGVRPRNDLGWPSPFFLSLEFSE